MSGRGRALEPNPPTPGQHAERRLRDRFVVRTRDLRALIDRWGKPMATIDEIRGMQGRVHMGRLARDNDWYGTSNGNEVPPLRPLPALSAQTGLSYDLLQKLRRYEYVPLDVADRILCAIGEPGALRDGRCPVFQRAWNRRSKVIALRDERGRFASFKTTT
jgi:hypothetical protein